MNSSFSRNFFRIRIRLEIYNLTVPLPLPLLLPQQQSKQIVHELRGKSICSHAPDAVLPFVRCIASSYCLATPAMHRTANESQVLGCGRRTQRRTLASVSNAHGRRRRRKVHRIVRTRCVYGTTYSSLAGSNKWAMIGVKA